MSTINTTLNRPPRSQGRPPGAKSKTSMRKVAEILTDAGKNPVEEIMKLLPEMEPKDQATIWLHLLKYCEAPALPKQQDDGQLIQINYTKVEPSES